MAERKKKSFQERAEQFAATEPALFNPKEFVVSAEHVQTAEITLFKGTKRERKLTVRYCGVPLKDLEGLSGTKHQQAIQMLWRMLNTADPLITKEDVENMDSAVAGEVLKALTGSSEVPLSTDSDAG